MYSTLQENTKLSPAKVNLLKTTTKYLKSNAWDSSSNHVSNQKTQLHINAKTFIPQAFQLTFIQTFRKYLGAFDKVKEYTQNHQTIHTYKNVIHKDYF
jgi:hypothetical protein